MSVEDRIKARWQRQREIINDLAEMTSVQAGNLPPEAVKTCEDALWAEITRCRNLIGKLPE